MSQEALGDKSEAEVSKQADGETAKERFGAVVTKVSQYHAKIQVTEVCEVGEYL